MAKKKGKTLAHAPGITGTIKEILEPKKVVDVEIIKTASQLELEMFDRYKKMLMAGFTQQQVIDTLDISQARYTKLVNKIPDELREKWKQAKIMSVENALHMSAIGFTKTIYKEVITKDGRIENLMEEKYFPPNVNAVKYYLNNMASSEWKDSSELVVNPLKNMSMIELEGKVKALMEKRAKDSVIHAEAMRINRGDTVI